MATYHSDLMNNDVDVFTLAAAIIKQGWDSHLIAKRIGGRDDLRQEVAVLLCAVKSGETAFDPARESRQTVTLSVSNEDYLAAMCGGDPLAAAYDLAGVIAGEDDDVDMMAECIYKTLSKGKEKKELNRVLLGKTSELTGGVVSFEGFVMGTIRRRSLRLLMIESPRPASEEQVAVDARIAADLGVEPGYKHKGEDEEEEEDALSAWAACEFLRDPDPDRSNDADTEPRTSPAQRILQSKSVDLASLFGCTPRTIQNLRNKAKPPGAD